LAPKIKAGKPFGKTPSGASVEALSAEERVDIFRKHILPYLDDIIRKDIEVALSNDRGSGEARSRLMAYMLGKPTERTENTNNTTISVIIKQKDQPDSPMLTVDVQRPESAYPALPPATDGEYRPSATTDGEYKELPTEPASVPTPG